MRKKLFITVTERNTGNHWSFGHLGPLLPSTKITPELIALFVRQKFAGIHPKEYRDDWEQGDALPRIGDVDVWATRSAPAVDIKVAVPDVRVGAERSSR